VDYLSGIGGFLSFVQLFFAIVIGLYFFNLLRAQQGNKVAVEKESRKEMDKLLQLRQLSLTEPLSEKTRPTKFEEIVGQEEGLMGHRVLVKLQQRGWSLKKQKRMGIPPLEKKPNLWK